MGTAPLLTRWDTRFRWGRSAWIIVALSIALAYGINLGVRCLVARDEDLAAIVEESRPTEEYGPTADIVTVQRAGRAISPLRIEKRPADAGEWLDRHPENGQTFEAYRVSNPCRATAIRTVLYIQPLGQFSEEQARIVAATGKFLGLFFGLPSQALPPIELTDIPSDARRQRKDGSEQILTRLHT